MNDDRLRYRLGQAAESLREANLLLKVDVQRGAVKRTHNGMFYALQRLLATKQLGASRHSGAIGPFDRELITTGMVPRDLSRALHLVLDRRQIHDYGDMIDLDTSVCHHWNAPQQPLVREKTRSLPIGQVARLVERQLVIPTGQRSRRFRPALSGR
ncbi:MAG: HEPN domain-containing protein [Caldilineales bacterium]